MLTVEQVREVIASAVPTVDAFALTSDAKFEDAGLDSLDHASILLRLEERYGIDFPDDVGSKMTSIRAIVAYAETATNRSG
jgi:acyl carrier protein